MRPIERNPYYAGSENVFTRAIAGDYAPTTATRERSA